MVTMHYREGLPRTFMGVENKPVDEAQVVVLPVPYEGTTSYKAGTRFGPDMIINASCSTETFDAELKREIISEVSICTVPRLESNLSSPENMINDVYSAAKELMENGRFLVVIGGEHSITSGIVRAFAEQYKDLTVLQIDAHADLRDEFEQTKYNHACVMRRVRESGVNVVQVGIRSHSLEEYEYVQKNKIKNIFSAPFQVAQVKDILAACTKNVYLSIDVDGFDPSIIPATGTPVPGGMLWYESLELFRQLFKKRNVIGLDVVELADIGSMDTSSSDTIATLIYRLIGYRFSGRR
jgi:agmatinase